VKTETNFKMTYLFNIVLEKKTFS